MRGELGGIGEQVYLHSHMQIDLFTRPISRVLDMGPEHHPVVLARTPQPYRLGGHIQALGLDMGLFIDK